MGKGAAGAVLLLMLAPLASWAQARTGGATVRGLVVSAEAIPVTQAVVELRARDSTVVRSVQSGPMGSFLIEGVVDGSYHLFIRRIGFGPSRTPEFTVAPGQIRDLGRITLQETAVQLEAVVVTVERPDVQFEPDRTGYLVEALTGAEGGVVTDAMRSIPDLTVEIDGSIKLRGATPAIYINGRPAPFTGVSLAVFLEQFPANQIERIETIDVPSARFGAEGEAGIINIVLKEGVELGITGSLSLAGGTRGQRTGSGRATLQRGPWVMTGGLNTRWSDSESSDFTLRQNLLADPITYLQQDNRSFRDSKSGGASIDIRYEPTKESRFWTRISGDLNGSGRDGRTETSHLDALQDPTLEYARLATTDGTGGSANGLLGYSYSWVPNRHTFEVQLTGQFNDNRNDTRDEISTDPQYLGDELLPAWLTRRESSDHGDAVGFEADYRRPLGTEGRVEVGTSFRRNASREDQQTNFFEEFGATVPDEQEDRRVSRIQRIGTGYLSLQRRFGKFGLVAGLRGEWVGSDIVLPSGADLVRNEGRIYPSLNLSWSPGTRTGVRLGYSQRVSRPGVSVLDPTDRSTDPLNRSVGNPDIESSTTHSVVASFSWSGALGQLSVGPYWNRTNDGWERITTVDADGISTTTWDNLTSRTRIGTSFNYGLPRIAGWRARVNMSASRSTITGSPRGPSPADGDIYWSVGANLDGTIVSGITGSGSFGYQPGRELVQGSTSGQWRADFSMRYRLMDNRTSISVNVQDPFELRKTTQQLTDPSVIQTGRSRVTTRSMTVNVSWAFGGGGSRGGRGRE